MGVRAWDSTAVQAAGDGRYLATVDPIWELAMVPQGGVLAAVAARAMATEVGTDQPLRTIHCVFASPVPAGEVSATVEVLRRGRSVSQATSSLAAAGAVTGLRSMAVFGGDRAGFNFTELVPPDVPAPELCSTWREPPPPEAEVEWEPPWPFWGEVVEGRLAMGRPFWDRTPRRGPAEVANWFRFDHPPVLDDGTLDPYALLVLADVMPGAVFARIDPTEQRWFSPSLDLSVHLFGHATPGWILAHAKAHHAGDGYASAEMALWDPRGEGGPKLVAWASQQMFFTRIS